MMEAAEELGKSTGVAKACQVLGVPRSSLYWARQPKQSPTPRPTPERALSSEEKVKVYQTLDSERFWDCSPREVYATLLDESIYLCHWRTMYRILGEHDEVHQPQRLQKLWRAEAIGRRISQKRRQYCGHRLDGRTPSHTLIGLHPG